MKTAAGNVSCTSSRWPKTLKTSTFSLRLNFPDRQPVPNMLHRWKQRHTLCSTLEVRIPSVKTVVFATSGEHAPGTKPKSNVRLTLAIEISIGKKVVFVTSCEHLAFQKQTNVAITSRRQRLKNGMSEPLTSKAKLSKATSEGG